MKMNNKILVRENRRLPFFVCLLAGAACVLVFAAVCSGRQCRHKEASACGKYPVVNDVDGSFLFSPRCVDGNRVYCLIEPSALSTRSKLPVDVEIEDNPILAEIYMRYNDED